jgi:23S rRNA (uracil1939-C5)-methyltransferase
MAVFVPRTAPGDVVQVAYVSHARHGRGRVLQIVTPSAQRVAPRCVHYERDRCGGCQLQHLTIESQREVRRQIVQDSLARIGRRTIPLPPLVHGDAWEYRGRLSLTLRRRGTSWIGGLHAHDDPSRVFALEECHIAHPVLVAVWQSVRGVIRRGEIALPAVEGTDTLRLGLRLDGDLAGEAEPSVAVVVEGGSAWPTQAAWTAAVREADARVAGVWWTASPLGTAHGGGDRLSGRPTSPTMEYAPQAREALAFAQVNREVATALRDHVFEAVQQFQPHRVIDGYAGTGVLSARLAEAGVAVVAIEADPAGADAAVNRLAGLAAPAAPGRVVCDLMERALPAVEESADVVVLNPPRRGVHPEIAAWLESPAQRGVRGVVYVSCDPATLARDLGRLPSWHVERVTCFDMFPQTAHVESVCVLRRENG